MKKNKNIFIVLLGVLVLVLGGFVVYNKVMKGNEGTEEDNKICDVTNLESENTKSCFQEYIKYLPLRYENSKLINYVVTDLTDKEISMAVWRYIYYINEGFSADGDTKLSQKKVNNYLKEYLNLESYNLKEMEITDNHAFGLKKSGNDYVISVQATEFSFANFEVTNISYDDNSKEVTVHANDYYYEMGSDNKVVNSTVTIKLKNNENNFNLISFTVND